MTRWHPRLELARLLDALSEDIIAATDEEVRQMNGSAVASTARDVKSLIEAARADKGSGAIVGPNDLGAGPRTIGASRRPAHQQRH